MSRILYLPFINVVYFFLTLALAGPTLLPVEASASFISYPLNEISKPDQELSEDHKKALENELIKEKFSELGLTKEEVIKRLDQLNPDDRVTALEYLATIQAGGGYTPQNWFESFLILLFFAFVLIGGAL